jgi:hypothetical protein
MAAPAFFVLPVIFVKEASHGWKEEIWSFVVLEARERTI